MGEDLVIELVPPCHSFETNNKDTYMKHYLTLILLLTLAVFSSCDMQKKVVYLQDVTTNMDLNPALISNIHVQSGDKLSILVSSRTPELSNLFNLAVPYRYIGANGQSTGQSQSSYYTVDTNGDIDFPIIGKLHVAGLTRQEISALVKECLISEDLLKDAVVTVEFGNLSFSVMGEVNAAGRYNIEKDQVTLLEALSMARDLTINGDRSNVLVLRTNLDGSQKSYRIDLTNSQSLYNSPAFYIRQHDVIYVQPNMQRARQSNSASNTFQSPSFWISLSSLACTIILMVQKL